MSSTSSKFIIHKDNKLVINVPYPLLLIKTIIISAVILDVIFGINLPVSLTFFISEEISMMPKALNSSKLSCDRIENEIACSLSGKNLFGNVEKAFDSKHGKLIMVMRKSDSFLLNSYSKVKEIPNTLHRDNLLILITGIEEIPLYTSGSLVDNQYYQLNKFLENKTQSKVLIQTQRIFDFYILNRIEYLGYILRYVFFTIGCYSSVFIALSASKKYIFDKQNNRIVIKSIFEEDLSIKIEFKKIKKVHMVLSKKSGVIQSKKILLIDNDNSVLMTIAIDADLNYMSSSEIADSICSFLQLEPYQTIEIPP